MRFSRKIYAIDIIFCPIAQKFIDKKSIKILSKFPKCRAFLDKSNKASNANWGEFAIKFFGTEFKK